MQIKNRIKEIVVDTRRKTTEERDRNLAENLASDHSRLLYSPAFRRLSKKAQVFSLESNAAVRSRITHSLEVSDVGRLIAYAITEELINKKLLDRNFQLPIIYAVENACLVHDIGNPPFGHFGEIAIQEWFNENWLSCYLSSQIPKNLINKALDLLRDYPQYDEKKISSLITTFSNDDLARISDLMQDFFQFDGNPQGLRILLRLKRDRDKFSYNLTHTTILSFIKYVRSPLEKKGENLRKKPGYFESERGIIEEMKVGMNLSKDARYLLAYIMEAADDIAYCISDIEDGLEKNILTENEFFNDLQKEWLHVTKGKRSKTFPMGKMPKKKPYKIEDFFRFKISYTQDSIKAAKIHFVDRIENLIEGKCSSLFPDNCDELMAFQCLKNVARKKLFRSADAENNELAGNQIVTGLLDKFKPLLTCSNEDFNKLIKSKDDPNKVAGEGLDIHWRLFNRLPPKHIDAYKDQITEFQNANFPEWYFRAHLIVDYISGMTDVFALEQYQLLSGIRIFQER